MRRTVVLLLLAVAFAGCADSSDSSDDTPAEDPVDEPVFRESVPVAKSGGNVSWDFTGPYSNVLEAGDIGILPPEIVVLQSDVDGVDIKMGLHLPDTDEPAGVLLFASPYFGFLGGSNDVDGRGGAFGSLVNNFVPHGYAVVGLAVRGTGDSGGCNDLMGPLETADLDQAVTWLGTQSWSNGNVAMTGVSYDGSTPWGVASVGNPHLKTIIPISGVPDMYGLMYRNGSVETRGPLVLNGLYYAGNIAAGTATPENTAERILCPDAKIGLGFSGVSGVTGAHDPIGWWQERDRKPGVEANYEGSVFSIQGMQDWNVDPSQVIPWVDELDKQGLKTKQLLGQWGHSWPDSIGTDGQNAGPMRADWKEILLRWLDSELKGEDVDTGPPVQVRDSLGRWRNELTFPPRDATWTTWHLGNGGLLSPEPGSAETVRLRPVVPLPDVSNSAVDVAEELVDFVLPKADGELLISGLPKVHVAVTPQGPGGYMGAYLYNRAPSGEMAIIGWTSMNLAFADGSEERTEVIPGQTIRAMMEIQPMDAVIPEGHELVLRLWVNTDADRLPTLPPGIVDLEIGHSIESTLILPTIERTDEYYFEPPVPA
ncbi:MAG: CocE/NonD family hydrolase [Thermoplasmatota archaeon]